jgi:hypothetical protein
MKLLTWILGFVFGCHHRQLSRVLTIKKRTYRVCLKCGRQFEYSWTLMHSLEAKPTHSAHARRDRAGAAKVPLI